MHFPCLSMSRYDKATECFMKRLYTFIKCKICRTNTALYQTSSNKIICRQCKEKGKFKSCIFAHTLFNLSNYFHNNVFNRGSTLSDSSFAEECLQTDAGVACVSDHTSDATKIIENANKDAEISKLSFSLGSYLESSPLKSNATQRRAKMPTPKNNSLSSDLDHFDCPLKPTSLDLSDSPAKTSLTFRPTTLSPLPEKHHKQLRIVLRRRITDKIDEISDIYMCFSNLNEYQHRYVAKKFKMYKKKYKRIFLCKKMSTKVTHLIINTSSNMCIRSYKYLYAGLRGIYILNFAFFIDLENQMEEKCSWYQFFVDGDLSYGMNSLSTNVLRKDNLIFERVNFAIDRKKTSYQLTKLVQLGGGTINSKKNIDINITIDHPCEIYDYISSNKRLG